MPKINSKALASLEKIAADYDTPILSLTRKGCHRKGEVFSFL